MKASRDNIESVTAPLREVNQFFILFLLVLYVLLVPAYQRLTKRRFLCILKAGSGRIALVLLAARKWLLHKLALLVCVGASNSKLV
jgi:hypothetical protein